MKHNNINKQLKNSFKLISPVFSLLLLIGCNNSSVSKKEVIIQKDRVVRDTIKLNGIQRKYEPNTVEQTADTIATISFPNLQVAINRLVVMEQSSQPNKDPSDSLILSVDLGESIEGQQISLSSDKFTDLKVEQSYETSVTIMNEGPHCDLLDWKHYTSAWKLLSKNNDGQFIGASYGDKETQYFPEVSTEELKKAIQLHCGTDWHDLLENIKSIHDYPSAVGISRYFLRITGRDKKTGQEMQKMIILENPMGC
ncbi:hypothetical protein LZQ00_03500 [Sphingobacterium sp. SRCM116780]|uniref:hypothetical protein n=1 Tax=Sphingobacterium sp. SRCM116780 TaxID=2907623 RepID=UPI001F20AB3E|nr:hypothetical protein [Sphingobacterium sp. SRCM116780]UIR56891.1 hypothetical protein LZQ00_03500 [Sphingobacterium sp. SRCM116780]